MKEHRGSQDKSERAGDLSPASTNQASASLPLTGFLTTTMVKRRYAIPGSTLHKWRAEGRFPSPVKIGARAVRYRAEDLRAFEEALEKASK